MGFIKSKQVLAMYTSDPSVCLDVGKDTNGQAPSHGCGSMPQEAQAFKAAERVASGAALSSPT
jgi:hypothetical protein